MSTHKHTHHQSKPPYVLIAAGIVLSLVLASGVFAYLSSGQLQRSSTATVTKQASPQTARAISLIDASMSALTDVESTTPSSPTPTLAGATESAKLSTNTVNIINVEGGSYYFEPRNITATVGEKVKIILTSVSMEHDLVIEQLGVRIPVTKSGETGSITFTPKKAGVYQFHCTVGKHKQLGMQGTLTILDPTTTPT